MVRRNVSMMLMPALVMLLAAPRVRAQAGPPLGPPSTSNQSTKPADLSAISSDALGWLQNLIRINTTNPPGNELVAAKYIAGVLEREGIHSETYESTPGRGFLVARLQANAMPDSSRALLLMAHLDVVGVDRTKWKVDPFGGVMQDGYIYGRGAIDDKGMLAANLAVFIELKRSGARLNRDVILLAEGDEENGGQQGIQFAIDKHWDKIAAGFAINEDGRVMVRNGKVSYIGVQTTEKVGASVDVIATGTAGHASVPRKDNAVSHLAAAIAKISTYEGPVQFNSVTRAYFEGLAPTQDEDAAKWIRALDTPDRGEHAVRWIADANPSWGAMLRDTVAPTMLQAGIRQNVIPSEARGVVNVRLLPGNPLDPLVAKLKELVNDPQVRFEVEPNAGESVPSSSLDSGLYNTITRIAHQNFPNAPVLPYMSTGFSDSWELRMRNVQAYGLVPFPLSEEDFSRVHGDNERIPVDAFRKGVDFLYTIVSDFAASK
jgi:acetylornithine deacetylase/succinyl-diaminopimelate desuccinylase-like protein